MESACEETTIYKRPKTNRVESNRIDPNRRRPPRLGLPRVLGRSTRTTAVKRVCRFYFPLIHIGEKVPTRILAVDATLAPGGIPLS